MEVLTTISTRSALACVLTLLQNTDSVVSTGSPESTLASMRRPHTPQRTRSPTSISSDAPSKMEPPAYTNAPYLDSPPLPYRDSSPTSSSTPCSQLQQQPLVFHISTPTDYRVPSTSNSLSYPDSDSDDDDDVPLAQLLLYPRDAPPAYSSVVRQSYRETLQQHPPRYQVAVDMDEEAALERIIADELRFEVEQVVAAAVVMALLVLAGVMVGLLFFRN